MKLFFGVGMIFADLFRQKIILSYNLEKPFKAAPSVAVLFFSTALKNIINTGSTDLLQPSVFNFFNNRWIQESSYVTQV